MHIPNGFLDPKTSAGFGFVSAAVLGYCIAKVRAAVTSPALQEAFAGISNSVSTVSGKAKRVLSAFGERYLIKMGLVASLIFSAQMFNFPINQGTSGHLLGGVLAAVILGPFGGTIVMAAILTIQSIFFGDGGLLALGANIFNMAVIGSIGGYYLYYGIRKLGEFGIGSRGFYLAVAIAAWLSVVASAGACALEIAFSGTSDLSAVFPAMIKVHSTIGIAEAIITCVALALILKIDRSFIDEKDE